MDDEKKIMTEEEAIAAIFRYKESTGKTQTIIAKELDISSGALSAFLAGTYKTPHTIVPKIVQLLNIAGQKEIAPVEPSFHETTVSKSVINTISYCHIQGKMAVVYGDAGVGKTMAINEYCRKNNAAIKITISPVYSSMSGVNELLAVELGVRERVSRKIYADIISKLKDSGRVIIIDEAQHLTVRTLNHLRCLADESGVGIALIGNDEVYSKMKGSGRADFAQLFSRIGMRKQVLTTTNTKDDIKKIFEQVPDDAIDILYRISRTPYGLRGAVNVFVNTVAVFGDITASKIARMSKEMNIC